MSYTATIVEIFLSSPSDVSDERDIVIDVASEWNSIRSKATSCYISVLTWENAVAPALGDRPQQVINSQIGNQYDVYLGLMWTRFGSPTGTVNSGTVEEYDIALSRAKSGSQIRVATIFKNTAMDISKIDPFQLQQIVEFKRKISSDGVFFREFSDDSSLKSILNLLFEQIAKEKDTYTSHDITTSPTLTGLNTEKIADSIDIEDIGLIEIGEAFDKISSEFSSDLEELSKMEENNANVLKLCTEEIANLSKFGSVESDVAKAIIKKASSSLAKLVNSLDPKIDDIEEKMVEMARLIDLDLKIRLEFDNPMKDSDSTIIALNSLSENIELALKNIENLINSTKRLPRFSSELAKSKRLLEKSRTRLANSFMKLRDSINNSLAFFNNSTFTSKPD